MRALAYSRFGSAEVLEIQEVEAPRPSSREVLVRVRAAGMNPKDILVRKGKFSFWSGRRFPKIPGYDFAGEVQEVGSAVRGFQPKDAVYGMRNGWTGGCAAELVAVPEDELAPMPPSLEWTEAAAVPLAALTALQALRDLAHLQPDQRVLINGASGGVGVFAVQIARILGAYVTTVSSARNLELCQQLGAQEALDYAATDPLKPDRPYDVIFDVFGNRPFARAKHALAARGHYVTTIPGPRAVFEDLTTRLAHRRARLVVVHSRRRDLEQLTEWIEQDKLHPVVDRVLPLSDGAAAHAHIETKRARGKVVLRVSDDT